MALTLYFVRFALGLNLLLLAIWAVCTVGPFYLQPPPTYRSNQISAYSASSILQGYGLDNTWFVYGAPHVMTVLALQCTRPHDDIFLAINVQTHCRRIQQSLLEGKGGCALWWPAQVLCS